MSAKSYNVEKATKQGNVRVSHVDNKINVVLHQTRVLTIDRVNNVFTLNSGGWRTNTTKVAINNGLSQWASQLKVFQKDFSWFVTNGVKTVEFFDGMTIDASLTVIEKAA